jgi:hypothetical protein
MQCTSGTPWIRLPESLELALATRSTNPKYTDPGVSTHDAHEIIVTLQDRVNALNDLALTLKTERAAASNARG